jgi:hypothetical protein
MLPPPSAPPAPYDDKTAYYDHGENGRTAMEAFLSLG